VDLLQVAEGLACSADTWPGLDDPVERCWRTVAVTGRFEAWVVAWPMGGAIELHDHGRSAGVVVVASGRLVETSLHRDAGGALAERLTTVASGDHVLFGPGHVHDLVNEGPGPALSVHVYTPALRAMTFFDRSATGGLVPVRTEHYRDGFLVG
jgi:mannose-6-phosphate isomerase-like protein (cupin superfamily)